MFRERIIASAFLVAILATGCVSQEERAVFGDEPNLDEAAEIMNASAALGKADKDRLVCIRQKTTGSRIPKRICMTQAERDNRTERDQDDLRNMNLPGRVSGGEEL